MLTIHVGNDDLAGGAQQYSSLTRVRPAEVTRWSADSGRRGHAAADAPRYRAPDAGAKSGQITRASQPLDTELVETSGVRVGSLIGAPDAPPQKVVSGQVRMVTPPPPPPPPKPYSIEAIRGSKRSERSSSDTTHWPCRSAPRFSRWRFRSPRALSGQAQTPPPSRPLPPWCRRRPHRCRDAGNRRRTAADRGRPVHVLQTDFDISRVRSRTTPSRLHGHQPAGAAARRQKSVQSA